MEVIKTFCIVRIILKSIYCLLLLLILSCNKNEKIYSLLSSHDKNDLISGAYKAGESGKKEFIPLLLKNADDFRTTTNLKFKGITVYQQKMIALKNIFKVEPPNRITSLPDSSIIKFYIDLHEKSNQ